MRKKRIVLSVLIGLAFIGLYLTFLRRIIHEKSARSLELTDDVAIADQVRVSITVIRVDLTTGQLAARVRLQLRGDIAQDATTPNIDLRFVINNSPGEQAFKFPKGEAVRRIEATLPMEGDPNRILSINMKRTSGF